MLGKGGGSLAAGGINGAVGHAAAVQRPFPGGGYEATHNNNNNNYRGAAFPGRRYEAIHTTNTTTTNNHYL